MRAGEGEGGAHVIELDGGADAVEGHEILLSIGRDFPLDGLGLESVGVTPTDGRLKPDERLRVAENVYVAGDVGGPEMHTHLGHYTGEAAARIALGDADYRPFLDAIPRATYTDPEVASVGLLLEQASERGIDAAEYTVDIGTSSKGYTTQSQGHCTIVVDRGRRRLVGAFLAGLAVSEAIHECVLAIRADMPLDDPRRHDPRLPDRRARPRHRLRRRRPRPRLSRPLHAGAAGVASRCERLHR